MDEEDGRPGALAAQAGHLDALTDAIAVSLCRSHPWKNNIPTRKYQLSQFVLFHRCNEKTLQGWGTLLMCERGGIVSFSRPSLHHQGETQ